MHSGSLLQAHRVDRPSDQLDYRIGNCTAMMMNIEKIENGTSRKDFPRNICGCGSLGLEAVLMLFIGSVGVADVMAGNEGASRAAYAGSGEVALGE